MASINHSWVDTLVLGLGVLILYNPTSGVGGHDSIVASPRHTRNMHASQLFCPTVLIASGLLSCSFCIVNQCTSHAHEDILWMSWGWPQDGRCLLQSMVTNQWCWMALVPKSWGYPDPPPAAPVGCSWPHASSKRKRHKTSQDYPATCQDNLVRDCRSMWSDPPGLHIIPNVNGKVTCCNLAAFAYKIKMFRNDFTGITVTKCSTH